MPLYHLMEDAATAEISRSQVWQWIHHRAQLEDSTVVTRELVERFIEGELVRIAFEIGATRMREGRFTDATALFLQTATETPLVEFLMLAAYPLLDQDGPRVVVSV